MRYEFIDIKAKRGLMGKNTEAFDECIRIVQDKAKWAGSLCKLFQQQMRKLIRDIAKYTIIFKVND